MGQLTARLVRFFETWDRRVLGALAILLALGLFLFSIAAFGPLEARTPALVGFFGALIAVQALLLWGSRRAMLTPYAQAQRAFIAGDFDAVLHLLEPLTEESRDVRTLTLLGNAYRQLGRLEESHTILSRALNIAPEHYFPLYGFGRTLLSEGRYTEAAEMIERALTAGAPSVVRFDLAEAYYRKGALDTARELLSAVRPELQEPFRVLMADFLLYRMDAADAPPTALITAGLPYWEASLKRFAHSPYGAALEEDVAMLRTGLKEQ